MLDYGFHHFFFLAWTCAAAPVAWVSSLPTLVASAADTVDGAMHTDMDVEGGMDARVCA